jgi:UDP-N-acetylmuramate dehydrogenase
MNSANELPRRFSGAVLIDEPMSKHTNYQIGGPADLFAIVTSAAELTELVGLATELEIPWQVLGNGTNILVADAGIRGLVIMNQARHYEIRPATPGANSRDAFAESGALIANLAKDTASQSLTGLHYAIGIPGSIGGAVVSNAAAHGHSFHEVVKSAMILCDGKDLRQFSLEELGFGYRSSAFKDRRRPNDVIVSVEFELPIADQKALDDEVAYIVARRAERLPTDPSAGSTFKNPPDHPVAGLIEKCNLKGRRIGNAQISPKHANFFINMGGASAQDIKSLIEFARQEVKTQTGIELELEIELIGDWRDS